MKKILICLPLLPLCLAPGALASESVPSNLQEVVNLAPKQSVVPGGVLLYTSRSRLALPQRSSLRRTTLSDRLLLLRDKSVGDRRLLEQVRDLPGVIAAEINGLIRLNSFSGDPMSYRMWGLENRYRRSYARGPYADPKEGGPLKKRSTPDADIDLPAAWRKETGSAETLVAVVDSGIDYYHEELQGKIWSNPGEIPDNGLDDDSNGFVDDVRGWNFVGANNDPLDDNSHGTHVAGTIGARSGNGRAVTGIAKEVSLLPVKSFSAAGIATDAQIAQGLLYAARAGADIVNGSFGGSNPMPVVAGIMRSYPKTLFVYAAGNDGAALGRSPSYPCFIKANNSLCVASTNSRDVLSDFSNYSKRRVQIAAPGEDILSLVPFQNPCPRAPGRGCVIEKAIAPSSADFMNWSTGGEGNDWGISNNFLSEYIGPGTSALEDSVSGNYAPNSNSWALSPEISMPDSPSCLYGALLSGVLERGEDVLRIAYSTNGTDYNKIAAVTGKLSTDTFFGEIPFEGISLPMPRESALRIKYSLSSDATREYSGASIGLDGFVCQGRLPNVDSFSGTSMATPHVSGVAALLRSARPEAPVWRLRQALLRGSDRKKSLRGKVGSMRRLNAAGALRALG